MQVWHADTASSICHTPELVKRLKGLREFVGWQANRCMVNGCITMVPASCGIRMHLYTSSPCIHCSEHTEQRSIGEITEASTDILQHARSVLTTSNLRVKSTYVNV
jgi:hypothetical protein